MFIEFILSFARSLLAKIIFNIYGYWSVTKNKKAFENRSGLFYKKISPHLLNHVLPEYAPDIDRKIKRMIIDDKNVSFPYIEIVKGSVFKIPTDIQTCSNLCVVNLKFVNWLKNDLEKEMQNNKTFSLNGISSSGELSICIGDYFKTISTSDIHYYNLIRYYPINYKFGLFFSYHNSKYIKNWLNSLKNIVINNNFSHYCASIGCSVLTVLKRNDGSYGYIVKENDNRKNSAHDRHVIPSFMLGPVSNEIQDQIKELDIHLSVTKEYGEELLNIKELEGADTYDSLIGLIQDNTILSKLLDSFETGEALLIKTGLVLDIYRLRPEITALLIINNSEFSKKISANWETKKGSLKVINLFDDNAYKELLVGIGGPLCAPGLAALINGRSVAIKQINTDFIKRR